MLKVYFTCPCSAPCRSACTKQREFSFALLKTRTNLIKINKSSTSHFAKITLHDYTDLDVKFGLLCISINCTNLV